MRARWSRRFALATFLAAVWAGCACLPAQAAPITTLFRPHLDCTVSTASWPQSCADPSLGLGIFAGSWGAPYEARALIRWDLSAIPRGSTISAATFYATPSFTDSWVTKPVEARPLLQQWAPGVTWTSRDGVQPWSSPGGAFGPAVDAAVPCCGDQSWNLTPLVDDWVSGDLPNRGLILVGTAPETDTELIGIQSTEGHAAPLLSVTYTPPAPAVLNAKVYVDDPSIPLTELGEEWQLVGGRDQRWADDEAISTLTTVGCSTSASGRCLEYRQRSRRSEQIAGAADTFARYRGTSENDKRVPDVVGEIAGWTRETLGEMADGSGPIGDVKFAWQTLPPGAGSTYELYESETSAEEDSGTAVDGPNGEVDTPVERDYRERLVVDASTGLPIRWTAFELATGELVTRRIFSYAPTLAPRSSFPADFFSVARPATPDSEKIVEFDDEPPGGGGTFAAASEEDAAKLSPDAQLDGEHPCFEDTMRMRLVEQPLPSEVPQPDGSHRRVKRFEATYARYRSRDSRGRCRSGPPDLTVRSAPRTGQLAKAWRQSYMELGDPLELQQRISTDGSLTPIDLGHADKVWLLELRGRRAGFYAEKQGAALVITGPLAADDVPALIQEVEVR